MKYLYRPRHRFVQTFKLLFLFGITLSLRAQTLTPLPPDAVPPSGIFYSAQNRPPTPFDWSPDFPVYSLGQGIFIVDDSAADYSTNDSWTGRGRQGGNGRARPMDDSAPSPPGDGGDGTNSYGGGSYSDGFPWTNGLWLEITGITNGIASVNLNNATNQVYAIWSTTNLLTGWNVETEVWPTNTAVMPFTVPTLDLQNLFMQA